jgi:hypothetical protein
MQSSEVKEREREELMSTSGELYDNLENIVASLYVLRHSCTGIIQRGESHPNGLWFQGAEAVLQQAVVKLQEVLAALPPMISQAKKEGKDWAHVEKLINKLDKSHLGRLEDNVHSDGGKEAMVEA